MHYLPQDCQPLAEDMLWRLELAHFFATSAVTADALFVIDPPAMQVNATSVLPNFRLANMVYLLALSYAVNARQFGERKIPLIHCFGSSVASAFRTLDWEIPNCRAILAGVMPALKAERTAFTSPRVNVASEMSACRLWELLSLGGNRFITEFTVRGFKKAVCHP